MPTNCSPSPAEIQQQPSQGRLPIGPQPKRWLARVPFPFGNPTTEAAANCASKVTSVEKGSFSGTLPGRKSLFGPFPVAAPAERPDHRLISKTPSGPQIEDTCCCVTRTKASRCPSGDQLQRDGPDPAVSPQGSRPAAGNLRGMPAPQEPRKLAGGQAASAAAATGKKRSKKICALEGCRRERCQGRNQE